MKKSDLNENIFFQNIQSISNYVISFITELYRLVIFVFKDQDRDHFKKYWSVLATQL